MSVTDAFVEWGDYRIIKYSVNDMSGTLERFRRHKANGVNFLSWDGFSEEHLNYLRMFDGLKIVILQGSVDVCLDDLAWLPQLEEISLGPTKHPLDLKKFPSLQKLSVQWHKDIFKHVNFSKIKSLGIWGYKPLTGDISALPIFPELEQMKLVQSTIGSLHGISNFPYLRRVELHYLNKLKKIEAMSLPRLTSLVIENCRNLTDVGALAESANLEELKLHECGSIASVRFVAALSRLKTFRFIGTNVVDGDLAPLLRLDDVFFTEKRNFSHKNRDFKQSI